MKYLIILLLKIAAGLFVTIGIQLIRADKDGIAASFFTDAVLILLFLFQKIKKIWVI